MSAKAAKTMKVIAECDCGKLYRLPEKYCGKHIRCKACGDAFTVPSLEESLEESGMEEDFPDPESEVVPPSKVKKKARRSTKERRGSKDDSDKARKRGPKSSGVRRGSRKKTDDDSEEKGRGKTRRDTGRTKALKRDTGRNKSVKRPTTRTKSLKTDSSKSRALKGKDKDQRRGTGKLKRSSVGKGAGKGARRRGRRGGDEDGAKKNNTMMYAGIGGVALILIIAAVVGLSGPPKPTEEQKSWYTQVETALDKGRGYKIGGRFLKSLEQFEAALAAVKSSKNPIDNPNFPEFKGKVEEARIVLPKLKELEDLLKKVQAGEGIEQTIKKSQDPDHSIRLASITLMEQKIKTEAKFIPALQKLAADSNKHVKMAAQKLLIKKGGLPALPFLVERLNAGPQAQSDAILRISQIADPKALSALHKCLTLLNPKDNKDDYNDAAKIIGNLRKIKDKSSVGRLTNFKDKCPDDLKEEIDDAIKKIEKG